MTTFDIGIPTDEMLDEMFKLQSEINAQINPAWLTAGYSYNLALGMECVEAIDSVGWKWWKARESTPNQEQLRLEVVDMWHFAMSMIMQTDNFPGLPIGVAQNIRDIDVGEFDSTLTLTEKFQLLLSLNAFPVSQLNNAERRERYLATASILTTVMEDLELSRRHLYVLYVAKNCLNSFRQNNGYKTGEYLKLWDGEHEDNFFLSLIVNDNEDSGWRPYTMDELYEELQQRYSYHTGREAF